MPNKVCLIGVRFGRLKVIKQVAPKFYGKHKKTCYECLCDCGKTTQVVAMTLQNGRTTSCGCFGQQSRTERTKHGMAREGKITGIYTIWTKMKARCNRPNDKAYPHYGGRGIYVCERWQNSFENFFADMGLRPEGYSLGRINNDGPYSAQNCRWETAEQQSRNMRTNRVFTVNGITACLAELAAHFGVQPGTVRARLCRGWSPHEAFTAPCGNIHK